jgi:hypothetical protein
MGATWNSLEIAKLVASALTPIVVAAFGYRLNGRLKSLEAAQWSQQKIVERRIKAYDDLAPALNRLFCFFAYVGTWKESTPVEMVEQKRVIDRCAHISAPLFDGGFLRLYGELLDCCFATFGGWGEDAKLRTLTDRRKHALKGDWNSAWDVCFVSDPGQASAPEDVKQAYTRLMAYVATAIGATEVDAHMLGTGRVPAQRDIGTIRVVSQIPDERDEAMARR